MSRNTNGAAGTATAGGSSQHGPSLSDTLVYWLIVAEIGIVALCFLLVLPRAVSRFSTYAEWTRGFILRKGKGTLNYAPPPSMARTHHGHKEKGSYGGESFSESLSQHSARGAKDIMVYADPNDNSRSLPFHVRSFTSFTHPVSSFFARTISPGVPIGNYLLVVAYFAVIAFMTLYESEPFARPKRLGTIAVSQIPAVFVFASKGNLAGMLIGIGYEKLNFFHRWAGVMIFVTSNLHTFGYVYKYANTGEMMEKLNEPMIKWGIAAQAGIELTFLFSLAFMRRRAYGFFLFTHVIGYLAFPIAVCVHDKSCIVYAVIGGVIFGLDHLIRLIKTRICVAQIKTIPELSLVHLELRSLRRGWRAGQHVRLRVLSREMGPLGWAFAHPFTIANVSEGEGGQGLVLLAKKVGSWTSRLYSAAEKAGHYGAEDAYGHASHRDIKVIVEGPYGGLGHMVLSGYSSALIVAGGSGISFGLAATDELVQQSLKGTSRVRFIEVIWVVQTRESIVPLIPTFTNMLDNIDRCPSVKIRITVYYTRAQPNDERTEPMTPKVEEHLSFSGCQLRAGRPRLVKVLDSLIVRTEALRCPQGIAVCICGPVGLADDATRTARSVDRMKANAVGGIEVHEEAFGW